MKELGIFVGGLALGLFIGTQLCNETTIMVPEKKAEPEQGPQIKKKLFGAKIQETPDSEHKPYHVFGYNNIYIN